MYRFQKFARKHKPALATAAAIAACLILGTTVSAWQAVRATTAEAQSNANEQKAVANEQKAKTERDEVLALNEKLAAKEQQLQHTLYAAHFNLAQQAWDAGNLDRVQELLKQHRPKPGKADMRGFEWHYLNRLTQADAPRFTVKSNQWLQSPVFSSDGKRLMAFNGGYFSRSADSGVSSRREAELREFDAQTGQSASTFSLKGGGQYLVFSPDAKYAAGASDVDQSLKVWITETGQEVVSIPGAGRNVYGVGGLVFSPDGRRLASLARTELCVWDIPTGKQLFALKADANSDSRGNSYDVRMAFNPDGDRLAFSTGTWDAAKQSFVRGQIKISDAHNGQELLIIQGDTDWAWNVAFSSDGKRLVVQGRNNARVWDAQTGRELFSRTEESDTINVALYSPNGKHLAIAEGNPDASHVKVCDGETGKTIFTLRGHASAIRSLAYSPDSNRLASSSGDRLRVWDLRTGKEIRTLRGHGAGINQSLAFSPDGNRLLSASGNGIKVWDAHWTEPTDHESTRLSLQGINRAGPMTTYGGDSLVVFSPDLKRLAGVSDNTVRIWDAEGGQELHTFVGHSKKVMCVAFSPDGKRLCSGDGYYFDSYRSESKPIPIPSDVTVWDAQSGREIFTLKGHEYGVLKVAFSPDGKRLASISEDTSVKIWDSATGQELLSFKADQQGFTPYTSLCFSPDGKRLASQTSSATKIWDAQTGREILSFDVEDESTQLAFSPDGKRLAAGWMVWDANTGKRLLTLKDAGAHAVFSPDGKRIASSSGDNVRIYDATNGQELLMFVAPRIPVGARALTFSPDGYRLGSVTARGAVAIWDGTPLPEKP